MADQNSQNPESNKTDPRLKPFLRKASAIIAAEKGLNADSRRKLQSLADHLKLPQALLEEAMTRLQQGAQLSSRLTHYEKAFVKFLDGELEKISGDIVSPRVENEAIARAKRKYDINGTRAEQLIIARAEAAGMSLISRSEAEAFAEQSIVDQVGRLTVIDEELAEQLQKIGKRWGLGSDDVERIIARKTARNKSQQKPRRTKLIAFSACFLFIVAGVTGTVFFHGWNPSHWFGQSQPTKDNASKNEPAVELASGSRFPDATTEELHQIGQSNPGLAPMIKDILSDNESQRQSGYQALVRLACSPSAIDRQLAIRLTCKSYYGDPDDESAKLVLMAIEQLVTNNPNEPPTIHQLKSAYQVNQLVAQLEFFQTDPTPVSIARKSEVETLILSLTGLSSELFQDASSYLENSETAIATDQWNRVLQTAWSSPTQAAVLLQPLFELTRSKLVPEDLHDYRDDTLVSIMATDRNSWKVFPAQIRQSVQSCDETRLLDWISIFVASDDGGLRDLLGSVILPRIDVKPKSQSREDIGIAIESFGIQVRNQALRPVLDRNELLDKFFASTVELEENDSAQGISPDRIAQLALAVNTEWAFCAAIENATHIDDASFAEFDRLISIPSPRLRELISLPIDRRRDQASGPTSATASDKRRMNMSLERLSDAGPKSSSSSVLAFKQLSQIAHRFERISYSEAEILANYLLSDLKIEDQLNVQKMVPAFAHWPNLTLAMADKLPTSTVQADQVLTFARILLNREFELRSRTDWRNELQFKVYEAISHDIENQIDEDPNNLKSNWVRLRIYLADVYRERRMLNSNGGYTSESTPTPHLAAAKLVEEMMENQDSAAATNIKRAVQLVYQAPANEIEKTAFANQLLIQTIIEELPDAATRAEAELALSKLQRKLRVQSLAGDKLYATEATLLQVLDLMRNSQVQRLMNQDQSR